MKLRSIIENLELSVKVSKNLEIDVKSAYASDLLSDVMGKAQSGQIWITMQTHKNVAAISSLKDIPAVIITGNGKPDEDMLELAESENVAILCTSLSCYEVCGKLYRLLESEI